VLADAAATAVFAPMLPPVVGAEATAAALRNSADDRGALVDDRTLVASYTSASGVAATSDSTAGGNIVSHVARLSEGGLLATTELSSTEVSTPADRIVDHRGQNRVSSTAGGRDS
jgi:hypothetical protein